MPEELEILKEVCRRLETSKIPYMITGSTASNFYAVPRMTRDIDIVIEIKGEASKRLQTWRLTGCELYVTLEPCVMCVGAILQARLGRLVFGCLDPKAGAVESLYRLCDDERLNHRLPVLGGVLAEACGFLLTDFFGRLRKRKQVDHDTERWPSPAEGA